VFQVICADIKKMYRQVIVHENHTPLQTILWRENPEEQVQMFKLRTVTYRTKPASFLAIKCLHELAELEKENFPIASQVITRDFYVDDLLIGSDIFQGVMDLKE